MNPPTTFTSHNIQDELNCQQIPIHTRHTPPVTLLFPTTFGLILLITDIRPLDRAMMGLISAAVISTPFGYAIKDHDVKEELLTGNASQSHRS